MRRPASLLMMAVVIGALIIARPAFADDGNDASQTEPMTLEQIEDYTAPPAADAISNSIRLDAMRDAALSFGTRGGLAHRSWELQKIVDADAQYLDRTFDFRALQMTAPDGLLVDLPVISEGRSALVFGQGNQSAAVADRVLQLDQNVRLTTHIPTWRDYILLSWNTGDPPPSLLLPQNSDERSKWKDWVAEGWKVGVAQADAIYAEDVDRLHRDFTGRVRYRELLVQHMVTPPYVAEVDRGITHDKTTLRIGDRKIVITQKPRLQPQPDQWTPAQQ